MNRVLILAGAVLGASSVLLIDSAIKGAALLIIATLAVLLLRRDSAATRHLVWLVAIVGLLVVPVFSAVLPQWRVLPAWAVIESPPAVAEVEPVGFATTVISVEPAQLPPMELPAFTEVSETPSSGDELVAHDAVSEMPELAQHPVVATEIAPEAGARQWGIVDGIPLCWAVGFFVLMLRLSAARLILWSSERRGTVVAISQRPPTDDGASPPNDRIVHPFQAACRKLGVRRPVRLLIHAERTIPVVWGIFRVRLLLPNSARSWSEEQLQSVLLHELGHIKRRDSTTQLLGQLACAFHWFNPLVWFASWRMHVE